MSDESHLRSLLKGLTWRALATLTTIIIAWAVVGDVSVALQIGAIEVVAKVVIYYLHERAWLLLPRRRMATVAGAAPVARPTSDCEA